MVQGSWGREPAGFCSFVTALRQPAFSLKLNRSLWDCPPGKQSP
jgi:hypothetical protein